MPIKSKIALFLLVACGPFEVGRCFGQIGYQPSSIEWLTASSDVVVRASVTGLAYKDRFDKVAGRRSDWQWVTVTLRVHETFKGKSPETIAFVVEAIRGVDDLAKWKNSGQSLLWFLEEVGQDDGKGKAIELPPDFPAQPKGKLRPRDSYYMDASAVELIAPRESKKGFPHFSMDFRVLDDEGKILAAVKGEASQRKTANSRSIDIAMPREIAQRSGRAGDVNSLIVPVNERLEQLARGWITSKDDWMRQAAVQALREFPSATNAALLRGVLGDKAWHVEHSDSRRERVYYIRESAYQTLQEWKFPVSKPLLREPWKG